MRGSPVDRIFTAEDQVARRPETEMRLALESGRADNERWHLRKDGSRFWASGEMMPLLDGQGEHRGFLKILQDRTREHTAKQTLRTVEASLCRAQEAEGVGLLTVAIADDILYPTAEFCRHFGLPVHESYPAREVEACVLSEDQGVRSSDNAFRRRGESPVSTEYRIGRADTGEIRWIWRRAEIERDETGAPVRFIGFGRPYHQVKARDEAAAERELLLRTFDQAPGFVAMLKDPKHHFTYANAAYRRLVGGREVVGKSARKALSE